MVSIAHFVVQNNQRDWCRNVGDFLRLFPVVPRNHIKSKGGIVMKSSLTLLVLFVLMLNMLAGCAPGANQSKGTANQHDVVAGFWLGLWQGFIASFVFVVSLFKNNLCIYEVHNNGAWYNFGYLLGLACFFGGGGNRAAQRK
jgi:hypothetical protein